MSGNNKYNEIYKSIFTIFLTLAVWEIVVRLGLVSEIFVSRPSKIFSVGISVIRAGSIFTDLRISVGVFLTGYILAAIVGIVTGVLLGFYQKVLSYVKGHVFILGSIPMMALLPLITIWVGIGLSARAVFVFLMVLVPILINTIDGVKNVDQKKIVMARSFGANDFTVISRVVFFDALPFIFSGMRSAVGRGLMGLIISEFFGYGKGLGYLISYYGNTMQTARYMFILVIVSILSLTSVRIIGMLEKRIIFWHKK